MTDDSASPSPSPSRGASDLETRLRAVMTEKGEGAPVGAADWGDLAGRLASTSRRRSRVFAGATAVALIVGAAGGYFGEAAASPGLSASRPAPSGSKAADTTVPGTARAATPGGAGPSAAMMCPDHATNSSVSDIGSATRQFVRTTSDGVTVRVYRLAPIVFSCVGPPTPVTVPKGTVPPGTVPPGTAPGVGAPGATGSSPGSVGSGGTAGISEPAPGIAPASQVTVELSDDNAVGQGVLSGSVCVGSPVQGGAGATGGAPPDTTTTTGAPATGLQDITTGTFGVLEGDPVWWVAVEVASDVTSVQMTFPDGSTDQMAPVGGIAVVAGRITSAVASADPGPYTVRGTLALLGAGGTVLDTITLPQQPAPVPGPLPGPEPLPLSANGAVGSSSSTIVACPQATTTTPKTQSSATTEKR